jgi:NhaA family Na+:H+ antiporter
MMASALAGSAATPIVRLVRPFQEFAAQEATGGILLLACTIAALLLANSPCAEAYAALWHTHLVVGIGSVSLNHDLHFWVNDGLMAAFFFVVGLEIKRELLAGELASPRQAALPVLASPGGVVVPALFHSALNASGASLTAPKLGILTASLCAGIVGSAILMRSSKSKGDRL